jgi:5-(carboxyamino)imidazole ribonucleotide mutase
MSDETPLVGIIMGSKSDFEHMQHCCNTLKDLAVPYEARVLSAHRTPDQTVEFVATAQARGMLVLIAAAGGAAHLAGVAAAHTMLPVLGVPMPSPNLNGMDSLLSTVQMPAGVPVGTLAIGKAGAINAAIFAAQIIATRHPEVGQRVEAWRSARRDEVLRQTLP